MSKSRTTEIRQKNKVELREALLKERQHLRELYFRLSGAQLKNVSEIKQTKQRIAVILTLIKETKHNTNDAK